VVTKGARGEPGGSGAGKSVVWGTERQGAGIPRRRIFEWGQGGKKKAGRGRAGWVGEAENQTAETMDTFLPQRGGYFCLRKNIMSVS